MTSYLPPAPSAPPRRSRRGLLIVLLVVGLAIVLLLAFIVVLLLRNPSASGQPSATTGSPSLTPSASASSAISTPAATLSPAGPTASATTGTRTVTATATKTATSAAGPQVRTFAVVPQKAISGATVTCTKAENLMVDFSWATSGATTVDFGVATLDASAAPYLTDLPASGSLGSARAVVFQCYADSAEHSQTYTLTVLSPGQKVSRTITLTEKYVP